jgi:hypothetical protein
MVVVELPVEGKAVAFLDYCCTLEDERRVVLDVESRDVLGEIVDALVDLLAALDEDREGAP